LFKLTGVALVAVLRRLAAGSDLESGLGHDLVESVGAAGEDLAGVAVAEDVALFVGLEGPLPLVVAAVALGLEGRRHFCDYLVDCRIEWIWRKMKENRERLSELVCPYLTEQTLTPPSGGLESDDGGGFDITGLRFGML
jgi:hypothetical protein